MLRVNEIYNEDCLGGLLRVDNDSIDLIVTSPPYNIGIDYDFCCDNLDWQDYFDWCEKWLVQCFRVLKSDGRIALNHYLSLGTSKKRVSPLAELNTTMQRIGFNHHAMAVWTDITLAKRTAATCQLLLPISIPHLREY